MSRTKITTLIIAAGAGASVWILASGNKTVPTTPLSLVAEIKAVLSGTSQQDSDHDGLLDWEENISGANPQKPDTDGDGYLDGEEVASGYSPLKQAPDDLEPGRTPYPRTPPKTLAKAVSERVAGTITRSVADAISKRGKAGLKPPTDVAALIDQSIPESIARELTGLFDPEVDTSRFTILPQSDKEARLKYLRSVVAIGQKLERRLPTPRQLEPKVIAEAISRKNFGKVIAYRDFYRKAEEEVAALSVPKDLVLLHQELLALLKIFGSIHQAASEFETDPLKTTLALQTYSDLRPRFERYLELLVNAANE